MKSKYLLSTLIPIKMRCVFVAVMLMGCGVKGPLSLAPKEQKTIQVREVSGFVPNQRFESFDDQYTQPSSASKNQSIQPRPNFETQEVEP